VNGKLNPFERSQNKLERRDEFVKKLTDHGMKRKEAIKKYYEKRDEEVWINDEYKVDIDRNAPHGFGPGVQVIGLAIRRQDRKHVHDWRDLQAIKNMLIGPEHEAIELYPAESRLYDSANQYWMWVFTDEDGGPVAIPIGLTGMRVVTDKSMFGTDQNRPFEDE
jgi:hypothetical protein